MRSHLAPRLAAGLVTGLVAATLAGCGASSSSECDDLVSRVAKPTDPLMSPELMAARPDERRDRLVDAAAAWGTPFGSVLAGVNYNYDQWLHLYGVAGGALAFTKRNAPVTFLSDEDLEPAWALRPSTKSIAWDASAEQFVLLSLPAGKPIQVQSYRLADAEPQWCRPIQSIFTEGDPLATTVLEDESVVVAAKSGGSAELVRLGTAGGVRWRTNLPSVDRGDFLGVLGDQVVLGGREDHHLASGEHQPPDGPSITAVSVATGDLVWRYSPKDGGLAHVVGVAGGRVVLLERGKGGVSLVSVRPDGRRHWVRRLDPTALQSAMRGGVVLLKSRTHYLGHDAVTGKPLWKWKIPTDRTFTPYGFTLAQLPSLDAGHVLMPTTEDLRVLDVRTGKSVAYPMPTDGISTTFWPYQLLATDRLLGVVTNTGAVVVRRNDLPE